MTSGKLRPKNATSAVDLPEPVAIGASLAPKQQGKGARIRRITRLIALLACALVLLHTLGCGGNSISGGSIPGGGSRLAGRVVLAESPTVALPNTTITIQAAPDSGATQTFQTVTDQNGMFDFGTIPTGSVNTRVQITARSSDPSLLPLQWTFLLTSGHSGTAILALPPTSFNVAQGTFVSLQPQTVNVHVGDSIQFTAQVHDNTGAILPVAPSLLLDGDFGTLNSNGTFTGTKIGSGTVYAFWYGNITSSSQVISDKTSPERPPPPPSDTTIK